jgi:NodT family efflux transporter outer membrane factor (OMF) lipoprotein
MGSIKEIQQEATEKTEASQALARGGILCFLCCLLFLSSVGCVTTGPLDWIRNGFKVGPNYERPPAPVAEEWIEAKNTSVQNRHLQDWWRVFQDPTLNSLIDLAYEQNPTLKIAGARVLEARAQQAIAVGSIFPQTQQATGQYSRINLSHNTFNNPGTIGNLPGILLPNLPFGNNYSDWTTGFNLSWELDFWGRFRRGIESANAGLDASVENYDSALVTLLADVATNYVQYRVAQQRIKIARANIQVQEELVAKSQKQFETGTATSVDVQQLRTLLEQTRSTIPALRIVQGQANDALCALLGLPPRDLEAELGPGPAISPNPPNAAPLSNIPAWVAVGIPADLLRRRPDIRAAERQVAAQSAQIGVAEAELYPTIFINGTLGYDAASLSKLFESRSFFGNITPNFKWNILNYGRIANNVHLQQAKTQELIATYQNQVLTAAEQAQTALRGFLRSREQAEMLGRSVSAAIAATKVGEEQFGQIRADVNRLYTLENARLQEEDNLAVAQGNVVLNLINVYRALGGGWEIRYEKEGGEEAPLPDDPGQKPRAKDQKSEVRDQKSEVRDQKSGVKVEQLVIRDRKSPAEATTQFAVGRISNPPCELPQLAQKPTSFANAKAEVQGDKPEVAEQKPKVKEQKSETRNWKQEVKERKLEDEEPKSEVGPVLASDL